MDLLKKMQNDIDRIWQQAVHAENPEVRDRLLKEYRVECGKFRKQMDFSIAMQEVPTKSIAREINL